MHRRAFCIYVLGKYSKRLGYFAWRLDRVIRLASKIKLLKRAGNDLLDHDQLEVDHVTVNALSGFLNGLRKRRVSVHIAPNLFGSEVEALRQGQLRQ